MRMRNTALFAIISLILLFAGTGCGPSYDEEGYGHVRSYAEEIIPAVDAALNHVSAGGPEAYKEVKGHAERINEINERYWDGANFKYAEYEEIENWTVSMSRAGGEIKWMVHGKELAEALWEAAWCSEWLAEELMDIYENEGEISDDDVYFIVRAIEDSGDAINELRRILFNR